MFLKREKGEITLKPLLLSYWYFANAFFVSYSLNLLNFITIAQLGQELFEIEIVKFKCVFLHIEEHVIYENDPYAK